MDAKELRIGLHINYDVPDIITKENIEFYCIVAEDINPIPLTEELLLKAGFKKSLGIFFIEVIEGDRTWVFAVGLDGSIGMYQDKYAFHTGRSFGIRIRIKSIHQLQNLYFTLTGEELTITLKS